MWLIATFEAIALLIGPPVIGEDGIIRTPTRQSAESIVKSYSWTCGGSLANVTMMIPSHLNQHGYRRLAPFSVSVSRDGRAVDEAVRSTLEQRLQTLAADAGEPALGGHCVGDMHQLVAWSGDETVVWRFPGPSGP